MLAVFEVAQAAVERARAGDGPTLIECKTYRHRGHTERAGAPDRRPAEELAAWKEKDPIDLLRASLENQGALSGPDFEKIDAEILQSIQDAVAFAQESPFPDPETALEDVFAS